MIREAAPFLAEYGEGSSRHNNALHTAASPSLRETSMVSSLFWDKLGAVRNGAFCLWERFVWFVCTYIAHIRTTEY